VNNKYCKQQFFVFILVFFGDEQTQVTIKGLINM